MNCDSAFVIPSAWSAQSMMVVSASPPRSHSCILARRSPLPFFIFFCVPWAQHLETFISAIPFFDECGGIFLAFDLDLDLDLGH
jgi:hypothetical protein